MSKLRSNQSEKLLEKLGMNGLEPLGLMDDDTLLDYMVIGKRPAKL